ncbi:MAG: VWA domain-containing protein [Anaerolineae bacterium]|nr:VWA domain-containing protein [Anaerolineae bacterium]MDW8071733.1 VWA domain-containing protein [Anaerolineae bacterium]
MNSSDARMAAGNGIASQRLPVNLLHFVRLLRRLGFRISAERVTDLLQGLTCIDLTRRDDFYHVVRACLVTHPDQIPLFDRAFQLFWLGREQWLLALGATTFQRPAPPRQQALRTARMPSRDRLDDRYFPPGEEESQRAGDSELSATYSPWETLRHKDFAAMSHEELQLAQRWMDGLIWRMGERRTRRRIRAYKRTCRLDLSTTMRKSMAQQGEIVHLAWQRPRFKPRPLVVICDISGSMERYSRLFLHFMYALRQSAKHIEAFVFGTRLTRITPALRHRDVDTALREVSREVLDWSGGTRIGESLKTFNYRWSRRVLRNGAVVIIISDGWDRGDIALLRHEMDRLRRSCHHLIWLNPLAGAPHYQPLVRGMQAALPYVDEFLPLHNLESLEAVVRHLGECMMPPVASRTYSLQPRLG